MTDRLDLLVEEGARFLAAVERGEPGAAVPSCPDWALRDLVHHTGGVHRWATRIVNERRTEHLDEELEAIAGGWPADEDLGPWFRAGHALLCDALRAAPEDAEMFAFLRGSPTARDFWIRRQLHETTIHRVDAELAAGAGAVTPVDAEHAVDGIDEMLTGFLPRRGTRLRPASTKTICVDPTDAAEAWLVTAGPDGATTERAAGDADVVVRGPAADLYLLVWNRGDVDGLDVSGDASLLDLWRSSVTIRWS